MYVTCLLVVVAMWIQIKFTSSHLKLAQFVSFIVGCVCVCVWVVMVQQISVWFEHWLSRGCYIVGPLIYVCPWNSATLFRDTISNLQGCVPCSLMKLLTSNSNCHGIWTELKSAGAKLLAAYVRVHVLGVCHVRMDCVIKWIPVVTMVVGEIGVWLIVWITTECCTLSLHTHIPLSNIIILYSGSRVLLHGVVTPVSLVW